MMEVKRRPTLFRDRCSHDERQVDTEKCPLMDDGVDQDHVPPHPILELPDERVLGTLGLACVIFFEVRDAVNRANGFIMPSQ